MYLLLSLWLCVELDKYEKYANFNKMPLKYPCVVTQRGRKNMKRIQILIRKFRK